MPIEIIKYPPSSRVLFIKLRVRILGTNGMKTNLGKLTEVGMKPIILIVAETLWIALLILGFVIWS